MSKKLATLPPELQKELNNAWLNITVKDEDLINPLKRLETNDPDIFFKRFTSLCLTPDYFSFVCKHILGVELLPIQALILKEMWEKKFPMLIGSRGLGKTFLLSLYCVLRALLMPGRKIVVVGAAFRQSKFLYEYMENIWANSGVLRSLCDSDSKPRRDVDMCRIIINKSVISALPIGDGQKIRGQRANDIVADEFASMSREIFENVIAGFAAVSADPVQNVKRMAFEAKAAELGIDLSESKNKTDISQTKSNQIIISGTAYYDFNHFADYWKKWKRIIETKGDPQALSERVFNGAPVPKEFNWEDYSILRIPVDLTPPGLMDAGQIARSKATVHNGIFLMEFGAVFTKDSTGFFKRTLIESCTGSDLDPVKTVDGPVFFNAQMSGTKGKKYIMGIDPASEVDNFSIVILELNGSHRRIVYCWTTTRDQYKEKLKRSLTKDQNFYSYCARKIRDLRNVFNVEHIAMDAQGGGIAVAEALHDETQLKAGEVPIWPVIDPEKEQDTDDMQGEHILELCQFAKYDWYSEANHGLRKDMEDKLLLFPMFDSITIGVAIEQDKASGRVTIVDNEEVSMYDTLEDCHLEIEELKDELSIIETHESANGRLRWDTPEVKIGVGKKERLRKDRYSALLMANMAARCGDWDAVEPTYHSYGGFAKVSGKKQKEEATFSGPNWFTTKMNGIY